MKIALMLGIGALLIGCQSGPRPLRGNSSVVSERGLLCAFDHATKVADCANGVSPEEVAMVLLKDVQQIVDRCTEQLAAKDTEKKKNEKKPKSSKKTDVKPEAKEEKKDVSKQTQGKN